MKSMFWAHSGLDLPLGRSLREGAAVVSKVTGRARRIDCESPWRSCRPLQRRQSMASHRVISPERPPQGHRLRCLLGSVAWCSQNVSLPVHDEGSSGP